ncbi:WD40 repeat domain-containing protein [Streptomyces sp. AN091965]|uniref:WD40 repeat domain-containing protein n=1 Tax=Streptomyces sp. AN091965 TaxID=2927803 RepID=UPI001F610852|nr:WD40 repeat domain-containing protein [Streptomyces sp. AN091965]MCI3932022.1 WD40 repeat domain-containing protein [Streptomyces sp. AN091965]
MLVGRREKPIDPAAGPVERFAHALRTLRREAGTPTYRAMAADSAYSATTLAYAVAGERLPSLPVALAYVKACGGDLALWERRWREARVEEAALRPRDAAEDGEPPYRGLARFDTGDQDHFFGRDRLTGELVGLAREHRVTTVFGPSGSGKSSLLRAGLIPRLRQPAPPAPRPAAIRVLTPGPRPLRTHERLFAPAPGEGDTWLVVDQFEEVFTLCHDPDEREEFIARLVSARAPALRLRVVLGVRADFYGRCLQHRELADAVREASLPVVPMSPAELREAIVRPAAAHGLIVERALTARLIEETLDEPGCLPLTSHALLETWRRRRGRTLTMAAYEASGRVAGALARTAEDLYTQLPAGQRDVARRILLRLITPGDGVPDTRRPVRRAELDDGGAADAAAPAARVLDRLARARLVTLDHDTADLTHEAVITGWPRLRGWIEEDRERLRCHRRLTEAAEAWAELGRDTGALYRGTRLATAEEHFPGAGAHPELTALERDFLVAGTAARDQEQRAAARVTRRLRRFTTALSVLLALVLAASLIAWQQSRDSDRERDRARAAQRVAQSRQLAAQSAALLGSDPDLASLLAVRAHRTAATPEAAGSLYAAAELPLRRRFTAADGPVLSVAVSPSGRTVATSGYDGTVRLWDPATGRLRADLGSDAGDVYSVAFSPDGRTLAASGDSRVRLWDVASGTVRRALPRHTDAVFTLAFSPDGRTLATGSDDGTVRLSDAATGRTRATLRGHKGEISGVAFGRAGHLLASSGADRTVRLWDTATGERRATLRGHKGEVSAVAFSRDGRTLASTGYDRTVRLWDVAARRTRAVLRGHTGEVSAVAFSPDGHTLASSGADRTVRLWNTATGRARTVLTGHTAPVSGIAFGPDGHTLASSGYDRTVRLWNTAPRTPHTTLTGQGAPVSLVAYGPDGRTLLTGGEDGGVRLWNTATGRTRATLTDRTGPVLAVSFSRDEHTLTTVNDTQRVRRWDLATGRPRSTSVDSAEAVVAAAIGPDGRTLAVVTGQRTVRLWGGTAGRTRTVLDHPGAVLALAFSRDGHTLATGSADGSVRLWDAAGGTPRTTLTGPADAVGAVAVSPDGRTVAAGSDDGTVRLWDAHTGRTLAALTDRTGQVLTVAFSGDGRTLAGGGADGTVRLWDTATGRLRARLRGHAGSVRTVAFSPDGRTLATGGEDATTRLWRTDLPTPSGAIRRICRAVGRDLTRQERASHLPDHEHGRTC